MHFSRLMLALSLLSTGGCFGGGGGGEVPGEPAPSESTRDNPGPDLGSDPEPEPFVDEPAAGSGADEPPEPAEPEPAPEPEPPAAEPFALSIEPGNCELSSTARIATVDGVDITPEWAGCWITWSGEMGEDGSVTSGVRVMIMPPNVSGSLAYPGARWLSVSIEGGDPGFFDAVRSRGYEDGAAGVVYVDTDDPAAAEAIDIEELLNRGPFDTTLLDGINWSGVGGGVELTALSGTVTSINPEDGFLDDSGSVDVTIDLRELTLKLLDGTDVEASGTINAKGQVGDSGGSVDPVGGEPYEPANCDQLWGLPDDIQVYSQCQTACVYADSQNLPENQNEEAQSQLAMAIEFSCSALEGFNPAYRSTCPFCN